MIELNVDVTDLKAQEEPFRFTLPVFFSHEIPAEGLRSA